MGNLIFFIYALTLNFVLIYLFALDFYLLYFICFFAFSYLLYKYYNHYAPIPFFLFLTIVVAIINLDIYSEVLFEIFLYLNIVDKSLYVNSEVMYILIALHLLVLINLKKFESFWDIIDKKLFRI